jgi:hypothetical protein
MTRSRMVATLVVILALAAGAFGYLYWRLPQQHSVLGVETAKALLNLMLIGIAAMVAKAVVDQHTAARERERQREERDAAREKADHALRMQALTTLTRGYWNAKKALKVIEAHRSAKSYGEQMRLLIDHRLELQQLDNEIMAGVYPLQHTDEICGALQTLDTRFGEIVDEWRDRYWELSHQQGEDEKRPPADKRVPREIDSLPALNAVRANGFAAVHEPFETAANSIRRQVFGSRVPRTAQPLGEQVMSASSSALRPTHPPFGATT